MSRTIGISKAIEEIAREFTRLEAEGRHPSSAYFFLVGAGISAPQVKLAGAIEQECRSAAPEPDRAPPPDVAGNPMLRYSHWLQEAHPNRAQRQEYFRSLIERRAISAANFRLAHLILSGRAPRLVVTPNFDDFLARALTLFGERPIVSDHPETAVRIDPDRPDTQILHVHGTYWFYDCCNLDGEIAARADLGLAYQTVGWRLANVLEHRAPIVLGYSGWEQDVIMTSLASRLRAPAGLPYDLYWFCYRRETIRALPDWLVKHDNVRFVVPDDEARDGASAQRAREPLKAVMVLDRLNRALGLDEPALTRNPIGFFADHLRASLLVTEDGAEGEQDGDVYRLQWTIEQLGEMRTLWDRRGSPEGEQPQPKQPPLADVQSAIRRSQHREAIDAARQLVLADLDVGELAELRETMMLAGVGLFDNSPEEIAAYDLVMAAADLRAERAAGADLADERDVATALLYKGLSLDEPEEALPIFQELVDRFRDHADEEIATKVAKALRLKGNELRYMGRNEETIAAYDELIDRFGDGGDGAQAEVAHAMLEKGHELRRLGRWDEAIAAYDRLIDDYLDDSDDVVQARVAQALLAKAELLAESERYDEELATYARIANYADQPLCETEAAKALLAKGLRLDALDRVAEALHAFDELVARYGDGSVPDVVAAGLLGKGRTFARHGHPSEANAAFQELITRYGSGVDDEVALSVARALLEQGDVLAALGSRDEAAIAYNAALLRSVGENEPEFGQVAARARARLDALDD